MLASKPATAGFVAAFQMPERGVVCRARVPRMLAPLLALPHERQLMRLVTYDVDGGRPRAGLLVDDAIVDAATSAADAGLDSGVAWSSVKAIIGAASDEQRGALQAAARDRRATSGLPVDGVTLHPPVPDPEKVLCIGLN